MKRNGNWEAAVHEAYPLVEQLEKIRAKYDVPLLEVSASQYDDIGKYAKVSAAGDLDKLGDHDLYMVQHSKIGEDIETTRNFYMNNRTKPIDIGLPRTYAVEEDF